MVEDLVFGVSIHAGERVVENQDARVANDGPRDRCALLLPARKGDSAFTHHGLISFRKFFDVSGDVRRLGRGTHLFIGRIFFAERNVLAHGLAEQESFLRHKADLAAQRLDGILAHRLAVDQHAARLSIVDTRDQADQRGLPGTGRPDNGQAAARRNSQINVMQNRRRRYRQSLVRGTRSRP